MQKDMSSLLRCIWLISGVHNMSKNTVRNFCLRMNYYDPDQAKIMDVIDNLNMDVHKSINKFIIKALKHYIDSADEVLINGSSNTQEYVTREEFEKRIEECDTRIDEMEKNVKDSLYKDVFQMLTGTLVVSNSPLYRGQNGFPTTQSISAEHDTNGMNGEDINVRKDDSEALTKELSGYGDVLSQVMNWSDD